jgi:hypothetical protein
VSFESATQRVYCAWSFRKENARGENWGNFMWSTSILLSPTVMKPSHVNYPRFTHAVKTITGTP